MSNSIIEVKNLSKKYNIVHRQGGYVALRDVLTNVFRNPFRFAKNKAKVAIGKVEKEEFWALRDINFTVEKGEAIGIIGANGAGKSTLLKILTEITPPTEGEVRLKGSVASLLEVGTGFHPELTGRENVFLNGAILGMTKKEIHAKFDDIVEFAGIEKFLDTPVKRYSSGMAVRLAFSVAAHLEPDILLVDEVLAVGDAEFQKKCLGKMDEVTKQAGRTILFVSHNMAAIQRLCGRCVLIEKGKIKKIGKTKNVVNNYLGDSNESQAVFEYKEDKKKKMQIKKIEILDHKNELTNNLDVTQLFKIKINYQINEDINCTNHLGIIFYDYSPEFPILNTFDIDTNKELYTCRKKGLYEATFKFPANLFNQQQLKLAAYFNIRSNVNSVFSETTDNLIINFYDTSSFASKFFRGRRGGKFLLKIPCEIKKNENY